MQADDILHLIHSLCVSHRTDASKIQKGQIIGLQGYLTQLKVNASNIMVTETEIAVDEFLAGNGLPERDAHDTVEPALEEAAA